MGKNQAKASEQIQETNSEVQKLAAAMKNHDDQMKEANQQAADSVNKLATTMDSFMERFTVHSENIRRSPERGIGGPGGQHPGARQRAAEIESRFNEAAS
eukprot:568340-Prymnesium_polylepis.1